MAHEARRKGTGIASAEFLPGVRLVRAFNAISFRDLRSEAHRSRKLVAISIAGDARLGL
jgi:predicted dinucleotide-binding enzyme